MTILIIEDLDKLFPSKGTSTDLVLISSKAKKQLKKQPEIMAAIKMILSTNGQIQYYTNCQYIKLEKKPSKWIKMNKEFDEALANSTEWFNTLKGRNKNK